MRDYTGNSGISPSLLLVVVAVTALRAVVASSVGLGDVEAYYWAWSQHPALSYYDHGPVVAWLVRGGTALFGHTPFGVRSLFLLVSGFTLLVVAILASRLAAAAHSGSRPAAIWAVALLMGMPAFMVAGGAANPDGPFVLAVAAFTFLIGPAFRGGQRSRSRQVPLLLLLAALVGLAGSCKVFGLALALPLTWLLVHQRHGFLTSAACCATALFFFLPVIVWNHLHGWPSVQYHLIERHTRPVGPSLANLGKLVGGQLGYVSPVILLALGAAALHLFHAARTPAAPQAHGPEARALVLTSAALVIPAWALILVVPGAEPHWPMPGYLPLLAMAAALAPSWLARSRKAVVLTWIGAVFSALVALAFHVHVLTDLGVRLMPDSYEPRFDLSNELRGWPKVAHVVARHVVAHQAASPETPVVVAAAHYTSCSQLAFAAQGRFPVRCPSPRRSQFDFFPGGDGSELRRVNLIYVRDPRFPFDISEMYRCLRDSVPLERVAIQRAGREVRRFEIQLCRGFDGLATAVWPPR